MIGNPGAHPSLEDTCLNHRYILFKLVGYPQSRIHQRIRLLHSRQHSQERA